MRSGRPLFRSLAALAGLLAAGPAGHANQDDLQGLRQRIGVLTQEIRKHESEHREATDALRASETAISALNRSLGQLSDEQRQIQANLVDLEQQRSTVAGRVAEQQEQLGRLLSYLYRHGGQDQFVFLFAHDAPMDLHRDLEYFAYLARSRVELVNRLRGNLDELHLLEAKAVRRQQELAANIERQKGESKALEEERLERQRLLEELADRIAARRAEVERLKKDEKRLTLLVERIEEELRSSREVAPPTDGKRVFPVHGGRITGRFGQARPDAGRPWRGLFIRIEPGQPVRAAADGKVVFADWLRGFGNLLIIDHGNDYMSLYAYNEALLREVGESVKGGDRVATTGNSGAAGESGLYFELRLRSEPVDPDPWLRG